MDTLITKKNKSLKYGLAIKVLSIISLICTVAGCISHFFYYDYYYRVAIGITFRPLHDVNFTSLLLELSPVVLFVLYIFVFHSKPKAAVLIPIIILFFVHDALFYLEHHYLSNSLRDLYLLPDHDKIHGFLNFLIFACSILSLISALNGFNKKLFIIIPMSVYLLYETLSLKGMFRRMDSYIYTSEHLNAFTLALSTIGTITLYATLLLFGLKNNIPSVEVSTKKMNPEQELKLLQCKLDLDIITEEEYQAQRAKIISKL